MEKLFFVLFGMILGVGSVIFYYRVIRKSKKSSIVGGGGQPGNNVPDSNDNQTT